MARRVRLVIVVKARGVYCADCTHRAFRDKPIPTFSCQLFGGDLEVDHGFVSRGARRNAECMAANLDLLPLSKRIRELEAQESENTPGSPDAVGPGQAAEELRRVHRELSKKGS